MQLVIKGKQLDVGQALRSYVDEHLGGIASKYFGDPIDATVLFSQEAHLYKADISVRVGRGMLLNSTGEATEIYPAFDAAAAKVAGRLKRYKSRLRDHHQKEAITEEMAHQFVLEANDNQEADGRGEPAVIAEMQTAIGKMTVAEAVMHMDLADLPAFMFRNSAHNGLNMVYRRADGNIGWVDPRGNLNA